MRMLGHITFLMILAVPLALEIATGFLTRLPGAEFSTAVEVFTAATDWLVVKAGKEGALGLLGLVTFAFAGLIHLRVREEPDPLARPRRLKRQIRAELERHLARLRPAPKHRREMHHMIGPFSAGFQEAGPFAAAAPVTLAALSPRSRRAVRSYLSTTYRMNRFIGALVEGRSRTMAVAGFAHTLPPDTQDFDLLAAPVQDLLTERRHPLPRTLMFDVTLQVQVVILLAGLGAARLAARAEGVPEDEVIPPVLEALADVRMTVIPSNLDRIVAALRDALPAAVRQGKRMQRV